MDFDWISDEQLSKEMSKYGLPSIPITETTRSFILLKLRRLVNNEENLSDQISESQPKTPEKSEQSEKRDEKEIYYGISVPGNQSTPIVKRSLKDVHLAARSSPKSRFKIFKTYEEAEQYSISPQTSTNEIIFPVYRESDPLYRFSGLKIHQLSAFRQKIEKNLLYEVRTLIISNPKYIINACDIPTIIHEGFRRNAFHVAIHVNSISITKFILKILKDIYWVSQIFQYDDPNDGRAYSKQQRYIDCIINMPEKGRTDTPLHTASQLGLLDIVKLLVNEPLLDRKKSNSFGDYPLDCICNQYEGDNKAEIYNQIHDLIEDDYFVLLDCYDNKFHANVNCLTLTSTVPYLAIFGPTSEKIANKISRLINNCQNVEINQYMRYILFKRTLSRRHGVILREYFRFIGTMISLTSYNDLELLETYISEKKRITHESFLNHSNLKDVDKSLSYNFANMSMNNSQNSFSYNLSISNIERLAKDSVFYAKWGDWHLSDYIISVIKPLQLNSNQFPNICSMVKNHVS